MICIYIYMYVWRGISFGGNSCSSWERLKGHLQRADASRMIDTWEVDRGQVKNLWVGNLHVGGKTATLLSEETFLGRNGFSKCCLLSGLHYLSCLRWHVTFIVFIFNAPFHSFKHQRALVLQPFFRGKLSWRVCSFFIIATAITIITITMVVVTAIIGMIDIPTVTYSFQITSRWFLHRCPCYLCHHYIIFVSSKPMGGTYHHHHDTWAPGLVFKPLTKKGSAYRTNMAS